MSTVGFSANNAPVLLLLFNAGPLDITWAKENSSVTAILEGFLPAQAAGDALYQILTMQNGSVPAGRLPVTWPASMAQVGFYFKIGGKNQGIKLRRFLKIWQIVNQFLLKRITCSKVRSFYVNSPTFGLRCSMRKGSFVCFRRLSSCLSSEDLLRLRYLALR